MAVPLPAGFNAVEITAGRAHACVSNKAGAILCWGAANKGQLGNRQTTGFSAAPVSYTPPAWATVVTIAAGGDTTCFLATNGSRVCVGDNTYNQMGIGGVGAITNALPRVSLLGDGPLVAPGLPALPPFLVLSNGATVCSMKLVVDTSITCERGWVGFGLGRVRKGCAAVYARSFSYPKTPTLMPVPRRPRPESPQDAGVGSRCHQPQDAADRGACCPRGACCRRGACGP